MWYITNIHFNYDKIKYIMLLRGENMASMIICLVGLSGSGKSFISKLLEEYNEKIVSLDIDKIGHKSLLNDSVKKQLVSEFGDSLLENGEIVRTRLSNVVFNSKQAMATLTDITWSYMENEIDEFIANNPNKIIVLDWLLLPKTKYFITSDLRILVTAPEEIRMQRVITRDNITREKFLSREASSPEINPNYFEYIINNVDKEKTKKEVEKIYDKSIIHR